MRVHVVANLRARGLVRDASRLAEVRRTVRRHGATLHETETIEAMTATVADLVRDGTDLLVLAGGDGTFMSGVTALTTAVGRRRFPKVGLLPLGTVGTVARNFGEKKPPSILLETWLSRPGDVHAIPRPTLRIEARRAGGASETRVGFIVGTGLVARFFEVYEAEGAGGVPHAGRIVARVFAESFTGGPLAARILTPIACRLDVDGVTSPLRGVSLLCAAVVRDLGLGMQVCYRAGEDPDRIHLVASGLPPSQLGPRAPLVVMGRTIGGPDHVDRLVDRFSVTFPDGEGPYVLDGDSFRAVSFAVESGPLVPILGPRD